MLNHRVLSFTALGVLVVGIAIPSAAQVNVPDVQYPIHFDISPPMRDVHLPPQPPDASLSRALMAIPRAPQAPQFDPALQSFSGPATNTLPGANFEGVTVQQAPSCNCAPPDTNMAAGPNHLVQWVNTSVAVYDKAGIIFPGYPKAGNSFWTGFGGACETTNSGDIIAQYDRAADRWLMSQLALSNAGNFQCFAVSTSPDPTGTYARYAYGFGSNLNDYPKITVWPVSFTGATQGAYFASYNIFLFGAFFQGADPCAYDRGAMLAGNSSATQVCFQQSGGGSLLPTDLDGATLPPGGEPGFYFDYGTNELLMWKFTPNFSTPSSSTFTGPQHISVDAFTPLSSGVPQSDTTQTLDTLSDRLMYRNAYRNFGDHEAVFVSHSVNGGYRWYEIRTPGGTPAKYQDGTFGPDSSNRWMGSIASDKNGDVAIGYSVSSSSMHPAIFYTGRAPGDPLGTMQSETLLFQGLGSQTSGLSRWGDYSAMRIDPGDDCTFWYTTEYIPADGTFNWHTRVGSFRFNTCGAPPPPPPVNAPVLTATAVSSSEIDLTWAYPFTDNDGFKIERCQGTGCTNFAQIAQVGASVRSYNDTGLACNTTYDYRIRAFNAGGDGPYSNTSEATTLSTLPTPAPVLTTTPASSTEIDLSWTASVGASSYDIYRCQGSNTCTPSTKIATVTGTTYKDMGLTPATTYGYQVIAVNGCGTAPSNVSYASTPQAPPTAPSNLTATPARQPNPPFIDLAWNDNSNNEDAFDVYRCTGASCTPNTLIATLPPNSTTYHDAGVGRKTTYRYQVFARNGSGSSGSNIATATTK